MLYARLDEDLLTRRHAAVARWLAVTAELRREGVAALIAPHLEKAGLLQRAGRAYLEAAAYEHKKMSTAAALRYVEKALPLIPTDDVVRRIDALHEHGSLLTTVGRYDEAFDAFTEMLRLAWTIGARGKGGAALNRLARVHRMRGEDDDAYALLSRALELFRAAGDLRGVASSLDDLAQVHRLRSETELAIQAAGEALEIRRAHGDRRGEAVSLSTLGGVELTRGNLDLAHQFFTEALDIRRDIGDLEGQAQSHNALGIVAYERGDRETAILSWRNALTQSKEMADRRSQCFLLNNIGEALLAEGRLDEASGSLAEAKEHADELGDRRAIAEVTRNLGRLAVKSHDESAEELLSRALVLAEEYGGKDLIALAHRALGELRAQTLFDAGGEADRRAEESFLASIDLFREAGSEKEAARSLAELGYHLIERGDVDSARERLREARALMRGMGLAELDRVDRTLSEIG
jgi:tetratricopeptide (TPR) repeat protein